VPDIDSCSRPAQSEEDGEEEELPVFEFNHAMPILWSHAKPDRRTLFRVQLRCAILMLIR
jgi:hypothetical protein